METAGKESSLLKRYRCECVAYVAEDVADGQKGGVTLRQEKRAKSIMRDASLSRLCHLLCPPWQRDSVLIPPDTKTRIAEELGKFNITEDYIYPDMGSVANEINAKIDTM